MTEPIIICPNCRTEIKLTESLAASLIEATRRDYEWSRYFHVTPKHRGRLLSHYGGHRPLTGRSGSSEVVA